MTLRRFDDERGMVTGFVAIVTLALFMAAGLVIDGGNLLAVRRQAIDEANAAARAGAQALDVEALRANREVRVDPGAAVGAAEAYLRTARHQGSVTVRGDTVVVTVALPYRTTLLGLVGMGTRTVSGRGEARLVRGVRQAAET